MNGEAKVMIIKNENALFSPNITSIQNSELKTGITNERIPAIDPPSTNAI